jgi:hypothetical protein
MNITFAHNYTVFCFVSISAKICICTSVDVNETLVEAKTHTLSDPSLYFSFNKCLISPNLALTETKGIAVCIKFQPAMNKYYLLTLQDKFKQALSFLGMKQLTQQTSSVKTQHGLLLSGKN